MACILVFVEQRNGNIRKASLEALSEAKRLASGAGWSVCAVLAGHAVAAKAAELGAYGASKVYVADEERLARYSSEAYAAVVREAAAKCAPSALFMAGTALGHDLCEAVDDELAGVAGVGAEEVAVQAGRALLEDP